MSVRSLQRRALVALAVVALGLLSGLVPVRPAETAQAVGCPRLLDYCG